MSEVRTAAGEELAEIVGLQQGMIAALFAILAKHGMVDPAATRATLASQTAKMKTDIGRGATKALENAAIKALEEVAKGIDTYPPKLRLVADDD